MKYIVYILCLFLVNQGFSQGIQFFEGTWEEALKKAEQEQKLIFVDAYTTWCGPCKSMAKNVFTKQEAGDFYNAQFINVKMDMEHVDNVSFVQKYPVRAYPTLMFIEGNGKIALKSVGGKKLKALISLGKKALLSNNKSEDYTEEYEKGERSYDFIIKYIKELNAANKSSLKVANDYLKSKPSISPSEMTNFIFESMTDVDSKLYELYVAEKKNIVNIHGEDAYTDKISKACHKTIDKAIEFESIELVEDAVDAYKGDKKATKKFELGAYKKYHIAMNDLPSYIKSVKSFYKSVAKNDSKELKPLISEMIEAYTNEEKIITLAKKYFDQLLKLDGSIENLVYTSQFYGKLKDNKSALKYVKMAFDKAKEEKKSTKKLSQMMEYYKNA